MGKVTWLLVLNFVLMQWFGVRVTRITCEDGASFYRLSGFVLPLTGWWSDYIGDWRIFWLTGDPARMNAHSTASDEDNDNND